ncbi:MAG: hypothetical protein ACPGES_05665 [Coraliomargarita sp.]
MTCLNHLLRPTLYLLIGACTLFSLQAEDAQLPPEESEKELATYMAELQVLTHKLGLSIEAENAALTRFYLHESLVKVEEIQAELPEYEGVPVALLLDRLAHPAYKYLRKRYDEPKDGDDYFTELNRAYDALLMTCNSCHEQSGHDYLRISRNSSNPYLQDFSPRK